MNRQISGWVLVMFGRHCTWTIFFALTLIFLNSGFAQVSEFARGKPGKPAENTVTEAASYLHAIAVNAESVRVSDVLLRSENFHDVATNEYQRLVALARIRIDWDAQRFLLIHRKQLAQLVPDDSIEKKSLKEQSDQTQAVEKQRVMYIAAVYDEGVLWWTESNGRVHHRTMKMLEALRHLNDDGIDLRFVGLFKFAVHFSPDMEFESFLSGSVALTDCRMQRLSSRINEVYRETPFLNVKNQKVYRAWRIDVHSLVPQYHYEELRNIVDGKPTTQPIAREEYKWKEFSGTYVPTEINGTYVGQKGPGNIYEHDVAVKLHWFSVNEPLADEYFSKSLIENYGELVKLIDPKLNGAHYLED